MLSDAIRSSTRVSYFSLGDLVALVNSDCYFCNLFFIKNDGIEGALKTVLLVFQAHTSTPSARIKNWTKSISSPSNVNQKLNFLFLLLTMITRMSKHWTQTFDSRVIFEKMLMGKAILDLYRQKLEFLLHFSSSVWHLYLQLFSWMFGIILKAILVATRA